LKGVQIRVRWWAFSLSLWLHRGKQRIMLGPSLIAIFPSRREVINAVDQLSKLKLADIGRAAVVARSKGGKTVLIGDHLAPGSAGLAGGTLGVLLLTLWMTQLGALSLPGIVATLFLGGAALLGGLLGRQIGRFIANMVAFGLGNRQIKALAERLSFGEAALIIEVDSLEALRQLRMALEHLHAEFVEYMAPS
jgi:uncharacterized membrane protein